MRPEELQVHLCAGPASVSGSVVQPSGDEHEPECQGNIGLFAAAIAALTIGTTAWADGPARRPPDFLDAQERHRPSSPFGILRLGGALRGQTPALFSEYVGGNMASCDYAGLERLADRQRRPDLGTSFTGSGHRALTGRRPHPDNVELTTTRLLSASGSSREILWSIRLFGAMADTINAGRPGNRRVSRLVAWKQVPGPLVDVLAAFFYGAPGFEIINLSFRANASGPLTTLAGYGPDGTPGRLFIVQTGFARTTFMGATADAFPAESTSRHWQLMRIGAGNRRAKCSGNRPVEPMQRRMGTRRLPCMTAIQASATQAVRCYAHVDRWRAVRKRWSSRGGSTAPRAAPMRRLPIRPPCPHRILAIHQDRRPGPRTIKSRPLNEQPFVAR
jgi:hypothetical protein